MIVNQLTPRSLHNPWSLLDDKGQVWTDFRSGIMTGSLGHGSPIVATALQHSAEFGLYNTYVNHTLAERNLRSLLGQVTDNRYQWNLLSTGAEAIDRALQIVSLERGRPISIGVVEGGFHGKFMHLAPAKYDCPWGQPMPVHRIPMGQTKNIPELDVILFEPVQSMTGQAVPLSWIWDLASAAGAAVIADEMVTGFYRCTKTCFVSLPMSPDFIVSGKGLGQGLPLSVLGVDAQGRYRGMRPPVDWSTTAAGNDVCARVGLYVLEHLWANLPEYSAKLSMMDEWFREIVGCQQSYGGLAFYHTAVPAALRKSLHDRRILATVRDDGVLRLGPCFSAPKEIFEHLADAIKESEDGSNRG